MFPHLCWDCNLLPPKNVRLLPVRSKSSDSGCHTSTKAEHSMLCAAFKDKARLLERCSPMHSIDAHSQIVHLHDISLMGRQVGYLFIVHPAHT